MDNEKEIIQPNYYGILPANVRYCKALPPAAKVLFTELSALTNKNGYCNAKNKYFADLYDVSERIVSTWFQRLEENGFIRIELFKTQIGTSRKIYLDGEPKSKDCHRKESSFSDTKEYSSADMKKCSEPQEEKFVQNNKNINTNNLNINKENAEKSATFENEKIEGEISNDEPKVEPKVKAQFKKENSGFSISLFPENFPTALMPYAEKFFEYRKEIKKPYKSNASITAKLKQFIQEAEQHGVQAVIESIETAIGQGWIGTFIDKKYTNNPKQKPTGATIPASDQAQRDELTLLKTKCHNKRIDFSHVTGTISEQIIQIKKLL